MLSKYRLFLINKINQSDWWHVPPQDPLAYRKRGKFLASTYRQAEFYGKPNLEPEQVTISNPLIGFSEREILKVLFPKNWKQLSDTYTNDDDKDVYYRRIKLDRIMYRAARRVGFDSIVLLTPQAKKSLEANSKPHSIELNLLNT